MGEQVGQTETSQSPHADCPDAIAAIERMRRVNPKADPLAILPDVHPTRIPRHVAVIMDGNGRWAEERGFPRVFGHRNGAGSVRAVVEDCGRLGIEVLTLYSFSMENWRRPKEEVDALMELCVLYCEGEMESLVREGIRFRVIGRRDSLPGDVVDAIERVEQATSACEGPMLCLAINYGSRGEIADAARAIGQRVKNGEIDPSEIDEGLFEQHLYTVGIPDPDLLIRTAGEMRVSNYLLWQISYAELHVADVCWPDFREEAFRAAIRDYAGRTRRFGAVVREQPMGEGA